MVDLLIFINKDLKNYGALQGQYSRLLIEKHCSSTFNDLSSLHASLEEESQHHFNIDIWKFYSACYVNSILYLPTSPSPSIQDPLFAPEHVESCISYLLFLWQKYHEQFSDAYNRLVSKITEAINNCQNFQLLVKWIEQGLSCKEKLGVDISSIERYGAIKASAELYKNAASADKNVILENLEKLKSLKVLNIQIDFIPGVVVGYALKWIEVANGFCGDQVILNQQVEKDPEMSKKMLNIIKELGITDEKLVSRINFLNEKFQPAQEIVWIGHRSQLEILSTVHQRGEVNVSKCKITWKGQEIEAAIKTYKDDNYKNWERCKKEAEILSMLSGKSKYFLDFYGCFFDEITENGFTKKCSNIVMEFCPWTLSEIMISRRDSNKKFTPVELNAIFTSLLEAFQSLANLKIHHQDIKPENILIDKNLQIKIADFNVSDLAEFYENISEPTEMHGVYGTPTYMAPELRLPHINGQHKARYRPEKADVFSLGLVFYQLATFNDISRFNEFPSRREEVLNEVEIDWIKNLLYDMLNFNYKERPSFNRALSKMIRESTTVKDS